MSWERRPGSPDRLRGRALVKRNARIAIRDQYTCYACCRVTLDGEVDHKRPLSQGGSDTDERNLGWMCKVPCHAEKSELERGVISRRFGCDENGIPLRRIAVQQK